MEKHSQIVDWAKERLMESGYSSVDQARIIVETPYSMVIRLDSGDNVFYLKQSPEPLFVESFILQAFADTDSVPHVLATNEVLCCFLMNQCGEESLRTRFAGVADWDVMCKAIQLYKTLQNKSVTHIDDFFSKGVPDWRFSKLPDLYQAIVADVAYLHRCGLNDADVGKLQHRTRSFSSVCTDLAQMGMPDKINHSDFQENNILAKGVKDLAIIDWGEVTIGNPLLSLLMFLVKAGSRYKINPDDVAYQKMEDCIFDGSGIDNEDRKQIVQQMKTVLPIYYILTLRNLEQATGQAEAVWSERAGRSFKMFMNILE